MNLIIFNIGKKHYFTKINNYLIIDFIDLNVGSKLFFKKIILILQKKIFFDNKGLNFKLFVIILKHFYIKSLSIKKKRRKNINKKIFNYKKKTLLFIEYIF